MSQRAFLLKVWVGHHLLPPEEKFVSAFVPLLRSGVAEFPFYFFDRLCCVCLHFMFAFFAAVQVTWYCLLDIGRSRTQSWHAWESRPRWDENVRLGMAVALLFLFGSTLFLPLFICFLLLSERIPLGFCLATLISAHVYLSIQISLLRLHSQKTCFCGTLSAASIQYPLLFLFCFTSGGFA